LKRLTAWTAPSGHARPPKPFADLVLLDHILDAPRWA
jgi:hypothetical protein